MSYTIRTGVGGMNMINDAFLQETEKMAGMYRHYIPDKTARIFRIGIIHKNYKGAYILTSKNGKIFPDPRRRASIYNRSHNRTNRKVAKS